MRVSALIVAAGKGERLGGAVPKQYQLLGGQMILTRTLNAVLACDLIDHVICVIHPDARALYDDAIADLSPERLRPPIDGGSDRATSVRLGLEALSADPPDRVLIHDAARPFVPASSVATLSAQNDAAILAEPVVDALWHEEDGHAERPVPRDGLWRAQTPQAFPFDRILAAHRAGASGETPALDDAETYRRHGGSVRLVSGSPDNFKITTAADMARAERLLRERSEDTMEIRTGHGFDVHRWEPGDGVWLCGVRIPHDKSLQGHSDADVGLHALADALYGALAEGDIGQHFPPSDPQWKGTESHVFLSHAAGRVAERGGRVVNADLTLLCESPKIGPHSTAMRERVAELLGIASDRVSVKATTMERMGFIGREEGMGCIANATIALPVAE
ncbi:MAG: bifunctional 2-C-methyl-D-erythritol 4-phosphate cytidylyltransferase/2-C-methyl-D-erythritol 2,4-cyclodiphosphate synthase [Pseudomonadota bacterium]